MDNEPKKFINTFINTISPSFSVSANSSISIKNQKNKFNSCLTGWNIGTKHIIKGYYTANNSISGSMEKNKNLKNKKNKKKNSKNNKFGKDFLKKNFIKKFSVKSEIKLLKKHNNKNNNNKLKKYARTTNNSRRNSREKLLESNKSKLFPIKNNKLILNSIRDLNTNIILNNNYHMQNQDNEGKQILSQTTNDNKVNKAIIQKDISSNRTSLRIDSKGFLKKSSKNNCPKNNQISRKSNQDKKLSINNVIGGKKLTKIKLKNENLSTYLKANILNNINIKSNSVFSNGQSLKVEKSQIKVNKINKMTSNNNLDNNSNKEIIFKQKYKNKNLKNIDRFSINEESLEIIKNNNQNISPTTVLFNNTEYQKSKKIRTAGNSPGRVKKKDQISPGVTFSKKRLNEKKIYFQNIKCLMSKESKSYKKNKNNLNLKSAHINRKGNDNKVLKENKNIKSENKLINDHNFKYYSNFYNYSHQNNSLRSNNASDKENNNSIIQKKISNYKSNNIRNNTNIKISKKVYKSIINTGNNLRYEPSKQIIQNNKDINLFDNLNNIKKNLTKYNSTYNSKYKLRKRSKIIKITNSPLSKKKFNYLYNKKNAQINDYNNHKNIKGEERTYSNLSGDSKEKEKIKKKKINDSEKPKNVKKKIINNIISSGNNLENLNNNLESKTNQNLNEEKDNKNISKKDNNQQLVIKKDSLIKSKKVNSINQKNKINDEKDLINNKDNNNENSSRLNISKIAKKSTHNRNVEQNFIFNSNTNTSLLSTMKDSKYYSQESENLSKYIKDYFNTHSSYPPTDISFYKFGRVIGRGAFGKVNIGLNILTGRIVAIKSFNKKNLSNEKAKKKILYETDLMRGLYHPAVTKILETFETDQYFLIIMEYISGGNLQNFVKKRRKLSEKTSRILFRQLIQGIKYIHSKGISHRDIKLENILLDLNNIVKICDFGVGKLTQKGQKLLDKCGTPVYMAPEIIKGDGYEGFPVDIWSAGVALYIMLSGNIPFNKDQTHDLQSAIINLPYKSIDDISESANDLLKNILEKDPVKRYTPDQILEHPWMNEHSGNDDDFFDFNYDLEIKNINKYHLFTNAESILLAKTHIDYRKAPKKDLAENFTIKNLYTIEDKKDDKIIKTKSIVLAPYNSMLTDYEEEEEEDDEDKPKIKKNKSLNRLYNIDDIKIKAINYYSQSTNPYDKLDNFNLELKIQNGIIKFHGKIKEFNMNYELNNNEEIDNGMLINSKDELIMKESNNDQQLDNYVKNNNSGKNIIRSKNNHRPSSPYKQPPINNYFVKMVSELGYGEDYVIKSLEKNELNHATTIYYLFSNYENIK
jgi:serine/threonine protein kinase